MAEKKKFFTKKKKIALAAAVLLLIAAAAVYLNLFTEVEKCTVVRGTADHSYTYEGVIENGGIYIITSEVSGRLIEYTVKENDQVSPDTVIARIDSTEIERDLAAARKAAGGATLSSAKRAYDIAKELYESGAGSRLSYESALAEYEQAAAEYADRSALISRLEDQLAKCEIKAGRAGVISSLPGKNLSVVEAGTEMAVINCEGNPSVKLDVLTNIAPYIKVGDRVEGTIVLLGQNEYYSGTVSEVYDYASEGTSSLGLSEYRVHVKVDLDNNETLAHRNGYGINIRFRIYYKNDVLMIPASAVFSSDGQSYVYKAEGSVAKAVPVKIEYNSSVDAVISEGLSEGDVIVKYANTEGLTDGARIR